LDSVAVERADFGAGVAGAGVGVAALVVLDAAGGSLQQAVGGSAIKLPALDERVDGDVQLTDRDLWIFFSAIAGRLWRETGS
jgi:hypothetical protein